jgi:hypothetical protein
VGEDIFGTVIITLTKPERIHLAIGDCAGV